MKYVDGVLISLAACALGALLLPALASMFLCLGVFLAFMTLVLLVPLALFAVYIMLIEVPFYSVLSMYRKVTGVRRKHKGRK